METMDAILSRRSIRQYTGEKVKEAELKMILAAAEASPSGMDEYENTVMTVIEKPELLEKIDQAAKAAAEKSGNADKNPLYQAPTFILVSGKKPDAESANLIFSNAAIVVENMALAATDLGVGCCHIWGVVEIIDHDPSLLNDLDLPEGFIPCCGLIVGKTNDKYTKREIPLDRIKCTRIK